MDDEGVGLHKEDSGIVFLTLHHKTGMGNMKLLSLVMVLAVVAAGCGRVTVVRLLPETSDAAGWIKMGATRIFETPTLWRYLDGDAQRYIRAGEQRTVTSEYRYQDRFEAIADVHMMSSSAGAKKLFESESCTCSPSLEVGDAARLHGQTLVFRKGRYLVRLVAYQDTLELREPIISLARAIEQRLPTS
jgi:hypothetical protein